MSAACSVLDVGVEGGLLELATESGNWTDRDDITPSWIMRVEQSDSTLPCAYIRGIVTLDDDGEHLLFGGTPIRAPKLRTGPRCTACSAEKCSRTTF